MVVDGGSWGGANQDEVWSDSSEITDAYKLFDGDLTTRVTLNGNDPQVLTEGDVYIKSSFEVYGNTGTNKRFEATLTIDGIDYPVSTPDSPTDSNQWIAFDLSSLPLPATVTNFVINYLPSGSVNVYGFRCDGIIMVDAGVSGYFGDDHVEYQTNGGEGNIISVNTDDNTLLISNTGDRDNRWIAENKAENRLLCHKQ